MNHHGRASFPLLRCALDLGLTWCALWMADFLRHRLPFGREIAPGTVYLSPAIYLMVACIWGLSFLFFGLWDRRKHSFADEMRALIASLAWAMILFAGALYFSRTWNFSRLLVVYFAVIDTALLAGWRLARALLARMQGANGLLLRTAILGTGPTAAEVGRRMREYPAAGFHLIGYIRAPVPEIAHPERLFGPILGDSADMAQILMLHHVDCLLIALPFEHFGAVKEHIPLLQEMGVQVYIAPDYAGLIAFSPHVDDLCGVPLIRISDLHLSAWDTSLKRAMDILLAAVLLTLTAPLFLIISIAIRLDSPGPIFFSQPRVGKDGRRFTMYKFRSMVADAEERLGEILETMGAGERPPLKIANDPRVTRVGRFLRRLSLDELPQLWNVLKGDMSMVGPRPEEPRIVETYNAWQRRRLLVKPGITGPMQVNGRADLSLDDRVRLEIDYIQHYSLWEDIKLLARTVPAIVTGKGSY